MKKSVYLLMMFIGVALTSCEPMEDIHSEIDEVIATDPLVGTLEHTLTEDDYKAMGLKNEYFASIDSANIEIPEFLGETYPLWGNKSLATITTNVANPLLEVDEAIEMEVSAEDYTELNFKYGNFDSADDMVKFLNYKFPEAETGSAVELTYKYYSGQVNTETNLFVKTQDTWLQPYILSDEDYTEMGQGRFKNFSNRADAESLIPNFLKLKFPYARKGETKTVLYDLHIGGGNNIEILQQFNYDGLQWSTPGGVVEMELQFGHNGTGWEPDNTIVYTLTPADYELTGNSYPNFNYWDQDDYDAAFEKIITVLETRFPEAEAGQKFFVYFVGYSGSPATYSVNIIVNEQGEFVLND